MAIELVKECSVERGFNFVAGGHERLGYVSSLTLGNTSIPADLRVAEEGTLLGTRSGGPILPGGETAGIYSRSVVAVLAQVSWSTLPTAPIEFTARVSVANRHMIGVLAQSAGTTIVVSLAWSVYEFDLVAGAYYPSFFSYKGTAPATAPKPAPVVGSAAQPIFGVVRKVSGVFAVSVDPAPATDVPGIVNHVFRMTLSPMVAVSPQQLMIQTSKSNKVIKAFGLPQN
jgi:hypothetical protein